MQSITLIKNGLYFDGLGNKGIQKDVLIKNGKIAEVAVGISAPEGAKVINAKGQWLMPGFIDLHTHYDAEVEVMPGLDESIRHGVTTVVMGNCSLSTALGKEEEVIDLFCRVENIPAQVLKKWLIGNFTWKSVSEYYTHLDTLSLGPNIASFLGHSNLRIAAMGFDRSLTEATATEEEMTVMKAHLKEALSVGFLGLSIDMLPFHRISGDYYPEYTGFSVPSQRASFQEYKALSSLLREKDRVLQITPNPLKKESVIQIGMLSSGWFRKSLKTTVVAALDFKSNKYVYKLMQYAGFLINKVMRGNLTFQTLSVPFLNYSDGPVTPLFEEIQSMVILINATRKEREKMFSDPKFRKQFRREWLDVGMSPFPKMLGEMWIVRSPDKSMEGKSFAQLAEEAKVEPVDHFMNLLQKYDKDLRWKVEATNHRLKQRLELLNSKYCLPGFNDSGAHNVNMAFHDGGLWLLKQAIENDTALTPERAIHRITKETADLLNIDAGDITVGKRADLIIVSPEHLLSDLTLEPHEDFHPELEGAFRLVKRSGKAVQHVFVGGEEIYTNNGTVAFHPDLGKKKFGLLLRANNA